MYIFADSGSSKTKWIITDTEGNTLHEFISLGLNPYFWTTREIFDEIKNNMPEEGLEHRIEKVFFYGSGCDSHDQYKSLSDALEMFFPLAITYIYSDMLGTARALFNRKDGIAAILGTGCNSCVFNGHTVYRKAVSLGYILGDEGSGANIGLKFIKKYLEGDFSEELTDIIRSKTGAVRETVLENIYSRPQPNRYLASFAKFISEHIEFNELQDILKSSFSEFFEKYILIFPEHKHLKLGFCGSIAYYFKDIIIDVAKNYKIQISDIILDPTEGIIEYHKEKGFF